MKTALLFLAVAAAAVSTGCVYHHEIRQTPARQNDPQPAKLDVRLAAMPDTKT